MLKRIKDLSNYSFALGISNSYVNIALSDDESVSSSDFLYMLENGSPLHNIIATRPIDNTWRTMQNDILQAYDDCIKMIIEDNVQRISIDERLINLAILLKNRLQYFVTSDIRSQIICHVFYKNQKIN